MGAKLLQNDVIGSYGVYVNKLEQTSSAWIDNQSVDVLKTTTTIGLDLQAITSSITQEMVNENSPASVAIKTRIEAQIIELLSRHVRLDIVRWNDKEQTIMVMLGDKVVAEKDFTA